ncbi:MAG: complex I subunit 5 family protein [Kiritimatiellales bacterium]
MDSKLLLFLVFFPILTSFLVYPLERLGRGPIDLAVRLVTALELAGAFFLLSGTFFISVPGLCGLGFQFTSGSLRSMLAIITAFMWTMTALASKEYFSHSEKNGRFYLFYLMTLGSLIGVFLAADLYTLFIFFEIMSFTSYVWVAQCETPQALQAAKTYLAVAVFGGMSLLVGLLLLDHLLGTLRIDQLAQAAEALVADEKTELLAAGIFCLIGFGAKAGVFPLHIWLPKAHPVAPAPASALLSGILTKSGVFGILIICSNLYTHYRNWNLALLLLSLITMFLGAVLALFSVDLKRTLACSSMSQIGFILLGIAMQGFLAEENTLASWGTILHILNHSMIKLVLFIAAGVIYRGAHSLDLSQLHGWGKNKPWLKLGFFIGAASICGLPLTSGYASKTLLHESIVEYIHLLAEEGISSGLFHAAEWVFLATGGLTIAYMAKLFISIFVESGTIGHEDHKEPSMAPTTAISLLCPALFLTVLGLTPSLTMENIASWAGEFLHTHHLEEPFHFYTLVNLEGAAISIVVGATVYLLLVRTRLRIRQDGRILYPDLWPKKLDLELLVFRPIIRGLCFIGAFFARLAATAGDIIVLVGEKLLFLRAPGIFEPKKNENFGSYIKKPRYSIVTQTFSFDLMLSGLGLIVTLLYVLFR